MYKEYHRPHDRIPIGRQGENNARQICFDISHWQELYGAEGRVELIYQRPKDAAPYPVVIERDGSTVIWTITATDTANNGYGRAELRYYIGDTLAKSATSIITVSDALDAPAEVPDPPGQNWLDQVLEAAQRAEDAADRAEGVEPGSGGGSGGAGTDGADGATFTPTVSEDGTLSWTNNKGLDNPAPVNIKGPKGNKGNKGDKGDTGATGAQGADGGYYTPKVSQPTTNTMLVEHTPSKAGMPAVEPVTINLPVGSDSSQNDYELPIAGDELGGVKNGGNVVINADGTMTAPESSPAVSQSANAQTYKTEDIGELFAAPADYTAWCPGNLRYDKTLGKFVSLLYAAPAHVHTTSDLYVTYIDPDSFVATEPVKCSFVDTDGVTDITPASAGACSFYILSDGTYFMIKNMDDTNHYKFTSADNGVTWQKVSAVTGCSVPPWNITELSNGRIIYSSDHGKVGMHYSDDDGVNWTQVIPATCGGGSEAEACILEVEPGKLIAIGRYSGSGKGYYESGDSEPAIFASSMDYGTTWTGWEISTVDNMNASSCTGVVHDGIVEIFATSRWYSNGGNVNTDNANTGKNGAMIHYMATTENALANNFTRLGIIDYAKGAGGDYNSPCAALDNDKRMLIVHMDGGENVTCNNRYLRGEIGSIGYACTEDGKSSVRAYSAAMVEKLLAEKQDDINYLRMALSKIEGSGVNPPTRTAMLVAQYVAADMAESLVYPWSDGSDFYGNGAAQYSVDTGATSTVHEFLADDNGDTYLKTYGCVVRPLKSEGATDCYIVVDWKLRSHVYAHVIKDGYITVADIQNDNLMGMDGVSLFSALGGEIAVEIHDGYAMLDGKKYTLPKTTVEDFIQNYTSYTHYGKHGAISELAPADSKEMVTTVDQCGVLLNAYHNVYSIKYYETY